MQLAVFGSTDATGFPAGWTSESAFVLFGSAKLDLTARPPAPDAALTACAIFGEVKIIAPAGSRVVLDGFCLFGSRTVKVQPGDGPDLRIRAFSLFGSVNVKDGAPVPIMVEQQAAERRVFPY